MARLAAYAAQDKNGIAGSADRAVAAAPPSRVSLWTPAMAVVDQGAWGSCTAFAARYAILGSIAYAAALVNPSSPAPLPADISTAWLYARSRNDLRLPLNQDTGSTNAATVGVVAGVGTVGAAAVPYWAKNVLLSPTNATSVLATPPNNTPPHAFSRVLYGSTAAVTLANFKAALASGKFVVVAIQCFASMMTTAVFISGVIPLPSRADVTQGSVGGHAIALCGYDDASETFRFANSWGACTGDAGFFTIPYAYITNRAYAGDAWAY